jgi:hypothetical protein
VHLLEEFARNYREIFTSEQLWSRATVGDAFSVQDLDRDGQKEIVFASSSFGSGGGSKSLSIYVPARRKLYTLTVQYQWSSPAEPSMKIALEPNPQDESDRKWLLALEDKARAVQFLDPVPRLDLTDARNAVVRWHKENGGLESGAVRLHYYEGEPVYDASIMARITDGDVTWTAYFKGPVYGYVGPERKHFVVYSPVNAYWWPTCLAVDEKFLWIGTRGNGIIRYDKGAKSLRKIILKFEGKEVLDVRSMRLVGRYFEVDGRALFDLRILRS